MIIGREQRHHPGYSLGERLFISFLGAPVVGLRIRARNLLRLLPPAEGIANVLDAGSGPGVITFLLAARYPEARVTGIDLSSEEIENCRIIAARAKYKNTDFEEADISHLPWKGHFDLIVCIDILEHIENDSSALESLAEALSPGSTLILHVPARHRRYPVFKKTLNFEVPSHVRVGYTLEQVKKLVEDAQLKILKAGHTFGFLETLANNIGYMITRAEKRNRLLYAVAFPFLNFTGWLGSRSRAGPFGAGIYVIGMKQQ